MILWCPARRRLRATQKLRLTDRRRRPRIVTGAAGDVWISSDGDFCVAGFVVEALCDTIRQDRTMVTPPDIEAQILRYYHAEKWTVGTIARQLHVHHSPRVKRPGAGSEQARPWRFAQNAQRAPLVVVRPRSALAAISRCSVDATKACNN